VKQLSVFRPRVAVRASGVPDPLIDQVVLDACIDFCERTLIVKRTLDAIPTVADEPEYDMAANGTQQSVAQVMRVWLDEREIAPVSEDDGPPPGTTTSSTPRFFTEDTPGTITLYPRPDREYSMRARVAQRPTRSATQVEDQLFEDWVEAIVDGALARLFIMPGDFLNPALAVVHLKAYQEAVDRASLQARQGRTRAQLRVTPIHI
jgi:hypothetical protein